MKLPLRMHRYDASFGIKDAAGTTICYVYFDKGNPGERAIRGLMSEEEAEPIAKQIARLLTDAETTKEPTGPEGPAGEFP